LNSATACLAQAVRSAKLKLGSEAGEAKKILMSRRLLKPEEIGALNTTLRIELGKVERFECRHEYD
jgi:hypothetical protein